MPGLDARLARLLSICAATALSGCGLFAHTNQPLVVHDPLKPDAPPKAAPDLGRRDGAPIRATFKVDGRRGNPRVLFFLSLSGGGSRAAYFSASTMLKLQSLYDDVDLLQEVDVISSVSGGSLPAAYYAASRNDGLSTVGTLSRLRARSAAGHVSKKIDVDVRLGKLTCSAALDDEEQARLRQVVGTQGIAAERVVRLCAHARYGNLRSWDDTTVRELMSRNYLVRWLGNWFWPHNILQYWFTAHDRSDIMAQTLEDNLYDSPLIGRAYEFKDLNPDRPHLIINATNATEQATGPRLPEAYAFGGVFTFTDDDFQERLNSDVQQYSVARAVMASSAFPMVFHNMTLADFRPQLDERCGKEPLAIECRPFYLHVFDGGNSDNLGLRSVKRALLQLVAERRFDQRRDKVVVMQVDAFTKPVGARREEWDPRGLLSLLVDFNVVDAVDSLLQANRASILDEFRAGRLRWKKDCDPDSQNLPPGLCDLLKKQQWPKNELDLSGSLVLYHFGFNALLPHHPEVKKRLDGIHTSFQISDQEASDIDLAVELVLTPDNPCLQQIRGIVLNPNASVRADAVCSGEPAEKTEAAK